MLNIVVIAALALTVCILLWLLRLERCSSACLKTYLGYISKEKQEQEKHWRQVYDVIQTCAGGINKRISEHVEITDAIQAQAPELLQTNAGLTHWLSANIQFFQKLRDVAVPYMRINKEIK